MRSAGNDSAAVQCRIRSQRCVQMVQETLCITQARPSARLQARSMLVVARATGGPGRALRCSDPQANELCAEPSFRPPGPVDMRVGEALILRHLLQAHTSRLSQCRRFVLWTHGACLLQLQRHYLRVEQ